jgi:hypothetical protein
MSSQGQSGDQPLEPGFHFLVDGEDLRVDLAHSDTGRALAMCFHTVDNEKSFTALTTQNFCRDADRGGFTFVVGSAFISQRLVELRGERYFHREWDNPAGERRQQLVKAPSHEEGVDDFHRAYLYPFIGQQLDRLRPESGNGLSEAEKNEEIKRVIAVLYARQADNMPLGCIRELYGMAEGHILSEFSGSEFSGGGSMITASPSGRLWRLRNFTFDASDRLVSFETDSESRGHLLFPMGYGGALNFPYLKSNPDIVFTLEFTDAVWGWSAVSESRYFKATYDRTQATVQITSGRCKIDVAVGDSLISRVYMNSARKLVNTGSVDELQAYIRGNTSRLTSERMKAGWGEPQHIEFFAYFDSITLQELILARLLEYAGSTDLDKQHKLTVFCRAYIAKDLGDEFTSFCAAILEVIDSGWDESFVAKNVECYNELVRYAGRSLGGRDREFYQQLLVSRTVAREDFFVVKSPAAAGWQVKVNDDDNDDDVVLLDRVTGPVEMVAARRIQRFFGVMSVANEQPVLCEPVNGVEQYHKDIARNVPAQYALPGRREPLVIMASKGEESAATELLIREISHSFNIEHSEARSLAAIMNDGQHFMAAGGFFSLLPGLSGNGNSDDPHYDKLAEKTIDPDNDSIQKRLERNDDGSYVLTLVTCARFYACRTRGVRGMHGMPFIDVTTTSQYNITRGESGQLQMSADAFPDMQIQTDNPEAVKQYLQMLRVGRQLAVRQAGGDRVELGELERQLASIHKGLSSIIYNDFDAPKLLSRIKALIGEPNVTRRKLENHCELYLSVVREGATKSELDEFIRSTTQEKIRFLISDPDMDREALKNACERYLSLDAEDGFSQVCQEILRGLTPLQAPVVSEALVHGFSKSCKAAIEAFDYIKNPSDLERMLRGLFTPVSAVDLRWHTSLYGWAYELSADRLRAGVEEERLKAKVEQQFKQFYTDAFRSHAASYQFGSVAVVPSDRSYFTGKVSKLEASEDSWRVTLTLAGGLGYTASSGVKASAVKCEVTQVLEIDRQGHVSVVEGEQPAELVSPRLAQERMIEHIKRRTNELVKFASLTEENYRELDGLCALYLDMVIQAEKNSSSDDEPAAVKDTLGVTCLAARKMIAYILDEQGKIQAGKLDAKKAVYERGLDMLFCKEVAEDSVPTDEQLKAGQAGCRNALQSANVQQDMDVKRNEPLQIAIAVVLYVFALLPGIVATILFHCLQWSRQTKAAEVRGKTARVLEAGVEPPQLPAAAADAGPN